MLFIEILQNDGIYSFITLWMKLLYMHHADKILAKWQYSNGIEKKIKHLGEETHGETNTMNI